MSEKTCASGLLDGTTHSVRGSDWQANSLSGLSLSPYISTHEICGVPGAPPGLGAPFAHEAASIRARVTTMIGRVRIRRSTSLELDGNSVRRLVARVLLGVDGWPGHPHIVGLRSRLIVQVDHDPVEQVLVPRALVVRLVVHA